MMSSLPIAAWPTADRDAWIQERQAGSRLKRGGRASHMKQVTRDDLERRYGTYLQFLWASGDLRLRAPAGSQVTPDGVHRFVPRVQAGWSSVTVAQSIYKLRRMAELLSPQTDFQWLSDLERDLALVANPRNGSLRSSPAKP